MIIIQTLDEQPLSSHILLSEL